MCYIAKSLPVVLVSIVIFLMLFFISGCADNNTETPTPAPTITLRIPTTIPASATPAIPPTPTLVVLNPAEIPDSPVETSSYLPASVGAMTQQVFDAMQQLPDIDSTTLIQLHNIQSVFWPDRRLGCASEPISQAMLTEKGIPGYRFLLGVEDAFFVYHTDNQGTVFLCEDAAAVELIGTPLIFDPTAVSLVNLAQNDLARELDILPIFIELIDFTVVNWQESSLGCPQAGADYSIEAISGFYFRFQYQAETYGYHSDGFQFTRCPESRTILPEPYPQLRPNSNSD